MNVQNLGYMVGHTHHEQTVLSHCEKHHSVDHQVRSYFILQE